MKTSIGELMAMKEKETNAHPFFPSANTFVGHRLELMTAFFAFANCFCWTFIFRSAKQADWPTKQIAATSVPGVKVVAVLVSDEFDLRGTAIWTTDDVVVVGGGTEFRSAR